MGSRWKACPSRRAPKSQTVTTAVYTDREGKYFFPPLTPPQKDGQYKVWAQAVGFELNQTETRLSAGKTVEQNLVLKPLKDISTQLSGSEWMASLPENTADDRRMKRVIGANCLNCHQSSFFCKIALIQRLDCRREFYGERMATAHRIPGARMDFFRDIEKEIVGYLARVRGPNSAPIDFKPRPRATGEATQIVVTEYDVSPGHLPGYSVVGNGTDWSLGTPSRTESAATHDFVWDPRGYVWFPDNVTPGRTIGNWIPRPEKSPITKI